MSTDVASLAELEWGLARCTSMTGEISKAFTPEEVRQAAQKFGPSMAKHRKTFERFIQVLQDLKYDDAFTRKPAIRKAIAAVEAAGAQIPPERKPQQPASGE